MRGVLQGGYTGLVYPLSGVIAAGGGGGSYDVGFDFWGASNLGTLQGTDTYVLGTDSYPTSRGGATFGWSVGSPLRFDSNTPYTSDSRILASALCAFSPVTFSIGSLPSGTYKIWVGVGELGGRTNDATFKDGSTTRLTISGLNSFYSLFDATNANLLYSDWVSAGGGASATITISSGTLNVVLAQSNTTAIAYLRLQKQ